MGTEQDPLLAALAEANSRPTPLHTAATARLRREIEARLASLSGRGACCGGRTLEEVGREFGVTPERIRQIEKARRKLRHPSRSKKLRDYLE